jgi:hypothetical protein
MNLQQAYLNVAAKMPISDDVKKRLDRAYDICISHGYTLSQSADDPTVWHVYRASTQLLEDNSAQYVVSAKEGCTCPDAATARGGMCKHRLAVMMKEE